MLFWAALATICVPCMSHFTFPALVFINRLVIQTNQGWRHDEWVHRLWCNISTLEERGSLNPKCSVIMSFPRHTHFPLCQCAFFEKCDKEFDNWIIIGAKELWVPVQQTEFNLCLQNLEVCSRPLVHLSGSKCGKAFQGGKKGKTVKEVKRYSNFNTVYTVNR